MFRMVHVLIAMAVLGAPVLAQTPAPAAPSAPAKPAPTSQAAKPPKATSDDLPRPTNAALFFWRAWNIQPTTLAGTVDAEFNGRDLAWTPSAETSKALEEAQGFLLSFVRATELPECDFGLEYSLGRDMDHTHLEKLRVSARILVSDTRRLQAGGKIDDAVRRVAALYSMARLVRQDRLTQSSASALGFALMASDEVRRLSAANVLSHEQRETLKKAADSLAGEDPFLFAEAIRREGAISEHFLTSRFQGDSAGGDLLRMMAQGGEPEPVVAGISALNQDSLKAEAAKVRDYYTQVGDAWTKDDAPARLHALEDKVLNLGFGPVAFMVCPGLSQALDNTTRQLSAIREARAMLDSATPPPAPASGPVPPK